MSILPKILPRNDAQKIAAAQSELMRFESKKFGRNIFGPIPKNHHRDFFCLDEYTWIWHEEWIDDKGQKHVLSTRYILRPDGAIKSQNGQSYQRVEAKEADHLYRAIKKYVPAALNYYEPLLNSN
jgi:hypothetical protein